MNNIWLTIGIIVFIYFCGQLYPKIKFLLSEHKSVEVTRLPFNGWWYTAVGGRVFSNHHIASQAQKFAYDFCIAKNDSGRTYEGEGKELKDYLCFDQPILAANAGEIALVIDGVPDCEIGSSNPQMVYGNTVMIRHSNGVVSVYAHLRKNSVRVREGDTIQAGDIIGHCGNSGNSSEPHLHFHLQSELGFENGDGIRPIFKNMRTKLSLKATESFCQSAYTPRFPEFVSD